MLSHKNIFLHHPRPSWFQLSLIVSLGLITLSPTPLLALAKQGETFQNQPSQTEAFAQRTSENSPLKDGVYLYGQSSQPQQIGQEYLVFQVKKGKVIGAFYMPQSEFSCFFGTLDGEQLNLSVLDPEDHSLSPYAIAVQPLSPVAANGQNGATKMGLAGFQEITTISNNDRRILAVCLNQNFK